MGFPKPAVSVDEQGIVVGCGVVRNGNAGGVCKLVRVANNEIFKRVLEIVGRDLGMRRRRVHADDLHIVRTERLSGKGDVHADREAQQLRKRRADFFEIALNDDLVFEFGRRSELNMLAVKREDFHLLEPKVNRGLRHFLAFQK